MLSEENKDYVLNQVQEEIFDSLKRGFSSKNSVIRFQKGKIEQLEFRLKNCELKFSNLVQEINSCLEEYGKAHVDTASLRTAIQNCIQTISYPQNPVMHQLETKSSLSITLSPKKSQLIQNTEELTGAKPVTPAHTIILELRVKTGNDEPSLKMPQINLETCNLKLSAIKDDQRKKINGKNINNLSLTVLFF